MLAPTGGLARSGPANPQAQIGPNAILQLVPVLEQALGRLDSLQLLNRAGILSLPDGRGMIPEAPVAALHRCLRAAYPDRAAALAANAGVRTADYILVHRIPQPAQRLLKILPWRISASILSKAIARNAWTFAGSGRFQVLSPLSFRLYDNPVIRGEQADHTLCHWHAAVFERLYRALVHPNLICTEVSCAATGAEACVFVLTRSRRAV